MPNTDNFAMTLESKEEVDLAKTAQRCIMAALDHSKAVNIALIEEGAGRLDNQSILKLPPKVLRLFAEALGALAHGKAVTLMPKELDLTTQEAAMFLNVSRPYLIRLLEQGRIPFHKVGTHRRIRFDEIVKYREARDISSQEALRELVEQAQELGMGY